MPSLFVFHSPLPETGIQRLTRPCVTGPVTFSSAEKYPYRALYFDIMPWLHFSVHLYRNAKKLFPNKGITKID
jgi:hypothetical protein